MKINRLQTNRSDEYKDMIKGYTYSKNLTTITY